MARKSARTPEERLAMRRARGRAYYHRHREKIKLADCSPVAVAAKREYDRAYNEKNRERIASRAKKYRAANADHLRAEKHKFYIENAAHVSEKSRAWKKKNPDRERAARRARYEIRKDAIRPQLAELKRRRSLAQKQAMPAWANEFFMREAYDLARRRTKVSGFAWHVDHVVPLRGKTVCGLHCEQNLAVIPGTDNFAKANVRWPDMPVEAQ